MSRSSRHFWSWVDSYPAKGTRIQPDEPGTWGCLLILFAAFLLICVALGFALAKVWV